MTFQEAILANQRMPVLSPSGEYWHQDSFSARALTPNEMFTITDILGEWTAAAVHFTARVSLHGLGGILLHPETGENSFLELANFTDTLVKVEVTKGSQA